ncbi:MAG: RNA polymerase sigma factor RpoD, partial [Variovorax sp.]
MPSSKKPAVSASKPAAKKPLKAAAAPSAKAAKAGTTESKPVAATKVKTVPVKSTKSTPSADLKKPATTAVATATATPAVKKVGRPPKAAAAGAAAPATGAKRGRKPKAGNESPTSDVDMSDIEDDLAGEPVVASTEEKVKPLRMKISKAKERALMKEFGLDETVLSEEDMAKRRSR